MSRGTNLETFRTFRLDITTSGTPERLSPKRRSATIAFTENTTTADTITDSGSLFLVSGFEAGMRITVSGSTSNDGTYTIASVSAGTITLANADDLATEAAGATVTIVSDSGFSIPDGIAVVVKAHRSNTGYVQVADSSVKADADNSPNGAYELSANESVSLQVKNTKDIFVDSTVSGDDVQVILEKSTM